MLLATGGVLAVGTLDAVLPAEITRSETANMVLGPFYPQVKPHDQDIDLTMVRGRRDRAAGQAIRVRGRVLNLRGEPVHNARVEI